MKKTNVRELHLQTSAIIKETAEGQVFVIERRGIPVAELRPFGSLPAARHLPDRETMLAKFPRIDIDSGRILEEDRE
ncbi:MAG: type II toxin-antitoxin system Phd/YefM family antitoxin [Acidobacteriota bacterium]